MKASESRCAEAVVREFWRLMATNAQSAEPISFFSVADGKITRLVEYWPGPSAAPAHRHHLTEPIVPRSTHATACPDPASRQPGIARRCGNPNEESPP